jgi:hypothetical protein
LGFCSRLRVPTSGRQTCRYCLPVEREKVVKNERLTSNAIPPGFVPSLLVRAGVAGCKNLRELYRVITAVS